MTGIGKRIHDKRESLGLSQAQVARFCGVRRETVTQWEADQRLLKEKHIKALCLFLGCSADWLLGFTDCRTPDAFDLLPEQTRADLQAVLNSPKRDKLLRLCAEVLTNEHQ